MIQEGILLAASTEKGVALLRTLVPEGSTGPVRLCRTGGEVRRTLLTEEFALVVINAPLMDENGLELSRELADQSTAGIVLLVKADVFDLVSARMEEYGVLVVAKPVVRQLFDQALRFSLAARSRLLRLREANQRLEKKLADQRLVDRAKCVLIQYLGMSEEQAHRYIEKQAMDQRQTKTAVARAVLATYAL